MCSVRIGSALVLFFVVALSATSPAATVTTLRTPDDGIEPQLAADSRGNLHLIYYKGDPKRGDVFYAHSIDAGVAFSPPIRANSQPDSALAIGTVRGATLAIGKADRVHVAWNGSDAATPKSPSHKPPMLYARLNDARDAFEPQRNVIAAHSGVDGGGAVAADAAGNVYVIWHAPLDPKSEKEADRRVWVARSPDDGKTFAPETDADAPSTGACGCC